MSIFRAMHLLELPSIKQDRIAFSRGERCGAIGSSACDNDRVLALTDRRSFELMIAVKRER